MDIDGGVTQATKSALWVSKKMKKTLLFDELGVSSFDVLVQNIILISPQQDTSHY